MIDLKELPPLEYFENGAVLLIDKPFEWSSFDVVNKVRLALCKYYKIKKLKIGHAGTLDPLATGLLILCSGKMTKKIDDIQALRKTYTGRIRLGATTPSFDLESEIDCTYPFKHITLEQIQTAILSLTGNIDQIPPLFSAVKKDGKRAYEYARSGTEVEIAPRQITIYDFKIGDIKLPDLDFEVTCSKGTYIRSLARDLGKLLDSGGYLTALRRTHIGDYSVENALNLNTFLEACGMPETKMGIKVKVRGAWKNS